MQSSTNRRVAIHPAPSARLHDCDELGFIGVILAGVVECVVSV